MRTVTAEMVRDMLAQQTQEVYLHLVKITHAELAIPLRFVDNTENITNTEGTYVAAAFRIQLPEETDAIPKIKIQIDNVDQSVIQAIRILSSAPQLEVSVIRASAPDVVEVGPFIVKLKQFDYNKFTITGTLGYDEDFLTEIFPKDQFTPKLTPGIF